MIKYARVVRDLTATKSELAEKPKTVIVKLDNMVQIVAKDVRFSSQVI